MLPLIFWIVPSLLIVSALPTTRNNQLLNGELHEEFQNFSIDRLNRMIELAHGVLPQFMTISVILTDCNTESNSPTLFWGRDQVEWSEETCGTTRMRQWCNELPGRSLNMITRDQVSQKSFMSHFQCELARSSFGSEHFTPEPHWSQFIIPGLFGILAFIGLLGIFYNFRKVCRARVEERKLNMPAVVDDLNGLIGKHNRKSVRFDENTDLSIGTVFTL